MIRSVITVFLLIVPAAFSSPLFSAALAPEADEIISRADTLFYATGNDIKANVVMIITDSQGKKTRRELVLLRKNGSAAGELQQLIYFKGPENVNRIAYLVHKNAKKDDDRWLYLPALDIVKRIDPSNKRTSFVGSHAFYEDISGRSLLEDTHALVKTTENFHVIINVPKDPKKTEFTSYKTWVDRKTFMPVKTEYIDKEGGAYRVIEALDVREIQGYPTIVRYRVQDLVEGGNTMFVVKEAEYDTGLGDIFKERSLKNPPENVTK